MDQTELSGETVRRTAYQVCGVLLLLGLWQLAGTFGWAGKTLPAFTDVLKVYGVSWRRALLMRATFATMSSAAIGWIGGSILGLFTATLARVFPVMEPGLDRLAVLANAVPAIALGPVLIITAGREGTPALLAAIPAFFLLYVAAISGLRSSDKQAQQYFVATGAGRWRRFLHLDLVAAVPSLLSGLKVAVTAAMIGAVVGEWFGAPTGLGIVILNTMQNFEIPLMWAAVVLVATLSLFAYMAIGIVESIAIRRMT